LEISNDIRSTLGFGPMEWGFPDWFCVDHACVVKSDGSRFSDRTEGDGRRVILVSANGPNVLIYPRSLRTESYEGHPHDAHDGLCEHTDCKISDFGHVVVNVPVRVDSASLNESTYSCTEPTTPLHGFLARKRSL